MLIAAACLSSCTQVAGWFGTDDDSTQAFGIDSSFMQKDESITEANAYSDLFLDSAAVDSFIVNQHLTDTAANKIRNFYRVRNYQFAWFNTQGLTEQGRGLWNLYSRSTDTANKKMQTHMDSLVQNDSLSIAKGDSTFMQTELNLTTALINYTQTHDEGPITSANMYYVVPRKKMAPLELADSILHGNKDSLLYSNNKGSDALKQQLAIYVNAAKDSSWKQVPTENIQKGSKSATVSLLKQRLRATNDYTSADTSNVFNDSLTAAIKNFQLRHGLAATGKVNDSLIAELNVPAEKRVEQILVNMNRMLWMPPQTDSNRIVVNIPALMLYAYEDTGVVFQMPVIVGDEGTSTIVFSGNINKIVFNPSWTVPESIVRNEILPKMKANPNYLKEHNMVITNQNDSVPDIKQLPGKNNALGQVKFMFPNSYDIYLHDTPDKSAFEKTDRTISHGCIRVANADKLAEYLLRNQDGWTKEKIAQMTKETKEQAVELNNTEPVYIDYFTVWVDPNGKVNFRPDVYGHDQKMINAMFTS